MPTVVAKGEFAAGFAVPSYMAFEEKLAGFDIKFVAPKYEFVTPEPMAILAGARNPKAARAFIEFLLTERGQKVFMERGLFPITPRYKVQGAPGSTAEMAVEFTGGVRSYFDGEVLNAYDEYGGRPPLGGPQDEVPLGHRGHLEEALSSQARDRAPSVAARGGPGESGLCSPQLDKP